jgi:hypothetical protein
VIPDGRDVDRTPVVEGVILCRCGRRMRLATRRQATGRRTRPCSRPLRARDRSFFETLAVARSRRLMGIPLGGVSMQSFMKSITISFDVYFLVLCYWQSSLFCWWITYEGMGMTVAKNQHFLPQFYLRYFLDPEAPAEQEPYVWVFEQSKHRWRRRAPKNVASLRHYYAYHDENGQLVNIIEPNLAAIESFGAALIRKLEAREILTEREQMRFAFFVALLTVRTPQHRELTELYLHRKGRDVVMDMIQHWREHPAEFESIQHRYQEKTRRDMAMNIDELEEHAPKIVPSPAGLLGYSLVPAFALAERLFEMTWRFYFTEDENKLIICDHPGEFALPESTTEESFQGFFTQDAEFHVPLTPNLVFAAHDNGFERAFGGLLDRDKVALLNRRMARRADQFVVSSKPAFLGDDVL